MAYPTQLAAEVGPAGSPSDNMVNINIIAGFAGEALGSVSINRNALGQDLQNLVMRQLRPKLVPVPIAPGPKPCAVPKAVPKAAAAPPTPVGPLPKAPPKAPPARPDQGRFSRLLHKNARINKFISLMAQDITDGSELLCVWVSIESSERKQVLDKLFRGHLIFYRGGM